MPQLAFTKYTSCGNNFVIVDELDGDVVTESEWTAVAFSATNPYFGIGSDNLLVIQRASEAKLREINEERHYWEDIPSLPNDCLIFRMFEPDGEEAFCCGNGLMSIAHHLRARHGITAGEIATEIPRQHPKVVSLGSMGTGERSWVELGAPTQTPAELVDRARVTPVTDEIDAIEGLQFEFRQHDLSPFHDGTMLSLNAYLVFTGEPHLVVFPETGIAPSALGETLFRSSQVGGEASAQCKRVNFGTWLLRRIGYHANRRFPGLFPSGVNVNMAQVLEGGRAVEYRTFERGIYRETLACGTGALAVSYVADQLNLVGRDGLALLPHRCRWFEPNAAIDVRKSGNGWLLQSTPRRICDGTLSIAEPERKVEKRDSEELAAERDEVVANSVKTG
ncbi:MAG: diaminopimelate epimerase [Gammaproteobacteria bacterium]|nr:diaminopimelate epimerase [Gammaproteobacteria bacterium]